MQTKEIPFQQVKSYELLINDRNANDLLENTFNFYNASSEFFLDFSLTLLGGIPPTDDVLKTFLCWFSLESKDVAFINPFAISDKEKIYNRFAEYWKNATQEKLDKNALEILVEFNYDKENFIFVDRRTEYYATIKQSLKLDDRDIELLFSQLPFFKSQEASADSASESSYKIIRTWISNNWGRGTKQDKNAKSQTLQEELNKLNFVIPNEDTSSQEFLTSLNIKNIPNWFKSLSLQKNENNKNSLYNLLLNNQTIPAKYIENLKNKLQEKLNQLQDKLDPNNQYSSDFASKILGYIEKTLHIDYYAGNEKRDQLAEAWSLAYGRILSSRSNACNQFNKRQSLLEDWDKRTETNQKYINLIIGFEKEESERLKIDSYNLRPKNINGLEEFLLNLKGTKDVEESLKNAKAEYDGKFGSFRFFAFLADKEDTNDKNLIKNITDAIELICDKRKADYLRLHPVRHISENYPVYPHFGNSRPKIKYNGTERNNRVELHTVTMQLYDGNIFKDVDIHVKSDRAVNEIFYYNPDREETLFRNTSLVNKSQNNNNLISPLIKPKEEETPGALLYHHNTFWKNKNRRWYLKISPKLEGVYEKKDDLETVRILGVDLGKRNPGCYAVINAYKDKQGKIHPDKKAFGKYEYSYDIEEYGIAKHSLKNWNNEYIDNLNDEGQIADAEFLSWGNKCLKTLDKEGRDFEDGISVIRIVHILTSKLKYKIKEISRENAQKILRETIATLSPATLRDIYKSPSGIQNYYNTGSLTETRLESFENWIRACKSFLDIMDNQGVNKHYLKDVLGKVEKKFINIRNERYRKLTNSIIRLAIDRKADVISIANLENLRPSDKRYRYLNRFLSRWYTDRIVKGLKDNTGCLSIRLQLVDPHYISHEDCDDTNVCRLKKVNLLTSKWDYIAKNLKVLQNLKTDNKKDLIYKNSIDELCKKYETNDVKEIKNKALERGESVIFVPDRLGYFAKSKFFSEPLDSDELAAIQVAKHAIGNILFPKVKDKKEADEDKEVA